VMHRSLRHDRNRIFEVRPSKSPARGCPDESRYRDVRRGQIVCRQAKWQLTTRVRDESNVPKRIPFLPAITAFHAACGMTREREITME
jgi:hypothetical protein